MPRRIRMSESQASAFEIYVGDPIHCEYAPPDGPSCSDYRRVAAMRKGNALLVPRGTEDVVDRVLTEATNSADSERTRAGDGAAKALVNLSKKLE